MAKKKDPLEGASEQGTTLEDFIITQKVDAFIEAYAPIEDENLADEVFDETRLRNFFKAVPCSLGDPLTIYLDILEMKGYRMKVSMAGEPAIFVTDKVVKSLMLV